MRNIIVGVGDIAASNAPGDIIKTFALGSCVAVILLDPRTHTVGMAHIALPEHAINPDKSRDKPGYFADTGIPVLVDQMATLGCSRNGRGFIVKLAGGAQVMDPNSTFNIGKRNVLAIKKILWKHGLGAVAEDIGGNISRTVAVSVDTGEVIITSANQNVWKL